MGEHMRIEVIESIGKKACYSLFGNVLEALKACRLKGKVVVVKDMKTILKYGITSAPALVINGIVVFAGKSMPPEEIITFLQQNIP
jgi:protein-disulfide isomerase